MGRKLKILLLILVCLATSGFASEHLNRNKNMKEFLDEISTIMWGCYGLETDQSSGSLDSEEKFISIDFSADYSFSERHAKKAILDIIREINLRLERSEEFNRFSPVTKLDPNKIQISIKINPKKRHRMYPAILFLDPIEKDVSEGSPLIHYIEAKDGKIRCYVKLSRFLPQKKLLSEETFAKAIKEVTGIDVEGANITSIPPIPNEDLILTEFIFRRTRIAIQKKFNFKHAGAIRSCKNKIEMLGADYRVPHTLSKEEARENLFICMNELLHEARKDEAFHPHLVDGFDEKNLEVVLYIGALGTRTVHPDICCASYRNGRIIYRSEDPEHKWRTKERVKETFEEAVTLLDKKKLELTQISAFKKSDK